MCLFEIIGKHFLEYIEEHENHMLCYPVLLHYECVIASKLTKDRIK